MEIRVQDYKKRAAISVIERYGIVVLLLLISILFGIFNPRFLTLQNFSNISLQMVPIGLLALGAMFVIITGGLDLTAGIGVSFFAVVLERLWNVTNNITYSVLAAFAALFIVGLINGLLISKAKFNSIIVTLIMLTVVSGVLNIVFNLSNASNKIDTPLFPFIARFKLLGIPFSFLLMLFFYIICYFVLNYTRFGIYIKAIGNNPEGARISGLNIYNFIFYTYIIAAFFTGLSSLVLTARVSYVNPNLGGITILLDALAAIIIGGVAIGGGRGTVQGVLIGTVSIAIINNMVNMLEINASWDDFFKGMVIVIMMSINRVADLLEDRSV
jgi:ribose/xylose/arabinose/galactoside ABC-type transport system permease subunit